MTARDQKLKSLMEEYNRRCAVTAAERQRQLKQEFLQRRSG